MKHTLRDARFWLVLEEGKFKVESLQYEEEIMPPPPLPVFTMGTQLKKKGEYELRRETRGVLVVDAEIGRTISAGYGVFSVVVESDLIDIELNDLIIDATKVMDYRDGVVYIPFRSLGNMIAKRIVKGENAKDNSEAAEVLLSSEKGE